MMKAVHTALGAIVLTAILAGPALAQQAGSPQIAYIDSQRILAEWPKAREAVQEFQEEVSQYQQRVQEMEADMGRLRQQFEQQQATLSPEAQQERLEELQERFTRYQSDIERLETQLETSQQTRMNELRELISTTVEGMRAQRNLVLVFDVAASGVVAKDPALDMTAEVLQRLQR